MVLFTYIGFALVGVLLYFSIKKSNISWWFLFAIGVVAMVCFVLGKYDPPAFEIAPEVGLLTGPLITILLLIKDGLEKRMESLERRMEFLEERLLAELKEIRKLLKSKLK